MDTPCMKWVEPTMDTPTNRFIMPGLPYLHTLLPISPTPNTMIPSPGEPLSDYEYTSYTAS